MLSNYGNQRTYGGVKVYYNPLCLEETDEPVKVHVKKPWMRESYHRRIQKKWTKRYGHVMKPVMYQVARLGIVAHPSLKPLIEDNLKHLEIHRI